MHGDQLTGEEIEFCLAEHDAFEKRYGLEGIGELLDCLLITIKEMIRAGEILGSDEGVVQAMALIVRENPWARPNISGSSARRPSERRSTR